MKQFVFITIFTITALTAIPAQEWTQFGDIGLAATMSHAEIAVGDPVSDWFGLTGWFTASGNIEMDHRLDYDQAMFRLHHLLEVTAEGDISYNLYEAYISFFPVPWLAVDIGKKHVNWGMGSLFLPTDAINPKTIDSTDRRQDIGFQGLTLTFTPNENFSIITALNIENSLDNLESDYWRDFRYGLLMSAFFGNLQIKTSLVYEPDTVFRPGLAASFDIEGFVFTAEGAVDFHNPTYYPESALVWDQPELWTPFYYVDAGVRKLAAIDDITLSFAVEYFFTSAGYTKSEESWFFEALGMGTMHIPQFLGQHYLYGDIGMETTGLLATHHSILVNLQDSSILFWHSVTLLVIENLDLNIEVMWTTGSSTAEFGLLPQRIQITAGAVFHF
ncbi:MAG: hypothetical protein JW904_07285 [Spirochaetales bacterium]|nr:hypothetical protein [Spirochaetales bacterium]